ncbi:MAG: hypothetical protein KF799_05920 [Bdellovibrionales bacterium]|nr:hypothetical protein [Bdellovibrionales bacterium]
MKRILLVGLFFAALLNGCSKCTRDVQPPPPEAPAELSPGPTPEGELPAEGEPATPALPDGTQGEDMPDESVD